jgi:hypothetical protein
MEWLTHLLGIEAPENTWLAGWDLGFRTVLSMWVGLAVLAAIAVGVFVLYAKERGRLGAVRMMFLVLLRTALLALVVALLLRPGLVADFQGERPRAIVLLLDSSQSMKQQDKRLSVPDRLRVAIANGLLPADSALPVDGTLADVPPDTPTDPARIDLVKAVLADRQRDLWAALQKRGPVRPFFFGARLRSACDENTSARDKEGGSLDRLLAAYQAEEARTGLADAVAELLQRKDGDLPAAVVLVTDGQDNASKLTLAEAARECGRLQVPLHIYGVGSSEAGLLQLREVTVPETIFYDDTIAVPVRWRARGLKKGTVQLRLTLGGEIVAEKEVPVRPGEDLRDVLTLTPRKDPNAAEKQELVATIGLKDSETFKDSVTRSIKLSDSRVKVLYLEDTPRWEYKFLQAALLRDRRVEAHFLLLKADAKVLQAGPPFLPTFPTREQLLQYDLVILGDVPSSYLGNQHMEWLKEYVRDFKGGLILIAGRRHAPASYDGTPLAEALPVEFLPIKPPTGTDARPQPYQPVLTTAGESSDMLALADTPEESLKVWAKLPGFYWHYPLTKLRPAATALLVHPRDKMGEQPMPLLARHYYGNGQVLFLATDETWRWRYNAEDKHFIRFWGQAIYQLALPHLLGSAAKRVQVALERSEAVLDRPGSVYARLLDKEFRPLKDKDVAAVLEYLDARPGQERTRKVVLHQVPGREGEYRLFLPHDAPGRFELKLPGSEESFHYRVDVPPRHELEESGLAEDALSEAARLSGGRFYREEDLHKLPEQVAEQKTPFVLRQEVLLWNPLVLVLFIGLITTEWVLRKFSNLS